MDSNQLTQMSRQAITDAQALARRRSNNEVETWHLLASLLSQENGIVPGIIDKLTAEIAKLTDLMSDPDLFTKSPDKFHKASQAIAERQAALDAAEEEWLILEEKAGG